MNKPLSLNDYQKAARRTAVYQDPEYPFLALAEEAGELIGKLARVKRGDYTKVTFYSYAPHELGDILWDVANAASELGMTLEQIAELNLDKLQKRALNNVLHGSGDNR